MTSHVYYEHIGFDEIRCDDCNTVFANLQEFQEHPCVVKIGRVKPLQYRDIPKPVIKEEPVFPCEFCGRMLPKWVNAHLCEEIDENR